MEAKESRHNFTNPYSKPWNKRKQYLNKLSFNDTYCTSITTNNARGIFHFWKPGSVPISLKISGIDPVS